MPKILNSWRVYTLSDPRTNEIRYVGITSRTITRRATLHIYESRHKRVDGGWNLEHHAARWLRQLDHINLRPIPTLIEEGTPDVAWADRERFWIAHFKAQGCSLTNSTEGGEGTFGWMPSPEDRVRRSQVANALWAKPGHRDLVAQASSQNWQDNREFMIERIKQAKAKPEEKLRQSLAKRGTGHHNALATETYILAMRRDFQDHRTLVSQGEESPYGSAENFYREWSMLLSIRPQQIAKIVAGRAWKHLLPQALTTNES